MRILVTLAALLAFSCSPNPSQKEPFKTLLRQCNTVAIALYNGGDTLHFNTTDSTGVRLLNQLVSGSTSTSPDTCAPVGLLRYQQDSQPLFEAQFAIASDAKNTSCAFITYQHNGTTYKHPLTDRARHLLQKIRANAVTGNATLPPTDTSAGSPNK